MKWLLPIPLLLLLACTGTEGARKVISSSLANSNEALLSAAALNVAATGMALKGAPNTNLAVKVATEFNSKAALLLPTPGYDDARKYQQIVTGLTSSDPKERAGAALVLEERDARIALLQAQRNAEAERLAQLELKLIEMGNEYEKEKNKSWWTRLYSALGVGGLLALALAFPVLIPIGGQLLGSLVSAVPSLASACGVVGRRAFDSVVTAVQKSKEKMETAEHTDALSLLRKELTRRTVKHERLIADRKESLNL